MIATMGSGSTDIATRLLELQVTSGARQVDAATEEVEVNDELRQCKLDEQRDARQRAIEEAESASTWGTIGEIAGAVAAGAGAVAAVAASVPTGGASLVAYATVGVGAFASVGATVADACGVEGDYLAYTKLAASGLMLAGGGVGLFAGGAAAAGQAVQTVRGMAQIAQGAAAITQGGATLAQGKSEAAALRAEGDVLTAEQGSAEAIWARDAAIDRVQKGTEALTGAAASAAAVLEADHRARAEMLARIGGA